MRRMGEFFWGCSFAIGVEGFMLHTLVGARPVVGYAVLACVGSAVLALVCECKANKKR